MCFSEDRRITRSMKKAGDEDETEFELFILNEKQVMVHKKTGEIVDYNTYQTIGKYDWSNGAWKPFTSRRRVLSGGL